MNRRPHPYQGCALPTELCRHAIPTEMVLEGGLEPPRITPYGPQPYASASSATRALTYSKQLRSPLSRANYVPNIAPIYQQCKSFFRFFSFFFAFYAIFFKFSSKRRSDSKLHRGSCRILATAISSALRLPISTRSFRARVIAV